MIRGRCRKGREREVALDRNTHQGSYGESFIRTLGAAAGFTVTKPEPDVAGIDFHIAGTEEVDDDYPLIKVQVKSWSNPKYDAESWHFRGINEKQFNVLAGRRAVPTFLFLVIVPSDVREYACADPRNLRLSHSAYWMSLADHPKIIDPDPRRSVRVDVPRSNLLTVGTFTDLCTGRQAGTGGGSPQVSLARKP